MREEIKNEDIKNMVVEALRQFYIHDLKLLEAPYEPTVSAKIAMYLHVSLTSHIKYKRFDVDCEYNHAAMDKKTPPKPYPHKTMRPDILIHRRALEKADAFSSDFNLMFCEVKIEEIDQNDKDKINCAIVTYHYCLGLSIHNIEKTGVTLRWVTDGQVASDVKLDERYNWDAKSKQLVPASEN